MDGERERERDEREEDALFMNLSIVKHNQKRNATMNRVVFYSTQLV